MLDDSLQAWDMLGKNPEVPSAEKMVGLSLPRSTSHNRGLPTASVSDPAETDKSQQVADVICVPIVKHIFAEPCNKRRPSTIPETSSTLGVHLR